MSQQQAGDLVKACDLAMEAEGVDLAQRQRVVNRLVWGDPLGCLYLSEPVADYRQEWRCPPPPKGTAFAVTRQEWNEDCTVRQIFAWVRPAPC